MVGVLEAKSYPAVQRCFAALPALLAETVLRQLPVHVLLPRYRWRESDVQRRYRSGKAVLLDYNKHYTADDADDKSQQISAT